MEYPGQALHYMLYVIYLTASFELSYKVDTIICISKVG